MLNVKCDMKRILYYKLLEPQQTNNVNLYKQKLKGLNASIKKLFRVKGKRKMTLSFIF